MDSSSGMIPSFKPNPNPGIQFEAGDRKAIRAWAENELMSVKTIRGRQVRDFDTEKIKKLSPDQRAIVIAAFHGQVPGNIKINQERVKEIVGELHNKNLENDPSTEKNIISKAIDTFKKLDDVESALYSYDFEAKEARSAEKTKAVEALYNEANSIDRQKRKVAKTALLVLKSSDIDKKHLQTLANHDVKILKDQGGRATVMVRKVAETLLGSGTFKDVYSAIDSKGETAVAFGRYFDPVPEITVEQSETEKKQWETEVFKETRALTLLDGKRENFVLPSKVRYVEHEPNGKRIVHQVLVMPRAGTDGWNWLSQNPSNEERADFMTHLLDAVKALEDTSCVHFDMKLENMLNHAGRWKISDFGSLSKLEGEKKVQPAITTPGYEAPEIVAGLGGDTKASCFTAGVMLAEVCGFYKIREKLEEYRHDPAAHEAYINQFRDVLTNKFTSSPLLDVIFGLLEPRPENRLSAHDAAVLLNDINIAEEIPNIQASSPESESEVYGPFNVST